MAKSWLDVQVDIQIARMRPAGADQFKSFEEAIERSPGQGDLASQPSGPDSWPLHVLNQQPRNLSSLLQKLHSRYMCHVDRIYFFHYYQQLILWKSTLCIISDTVHEAVSRACKEQQRQIEVTISVEGSFLFCFK